MSRAVATRKPARKKSINDSVRSANRLIESRLRRGNSAGQLSENGSASQCTISPRTAPRTDFYREGRQGHEDGYLPQSRQGTEEPGRRSGAYPHSPYQRRARGL